MKVISSKQMAYLESQAYRNGSTEEEFMENAGKGIAIETDAFIEERHLPSEVILFCGKGNNAGDAYVAGVYLLSWGYAVSAVQISPLENASPLCRQNANRFKKSGGMIHDINHPEEIKFPQFGVILDGVFGTGFHGTAKEPYSSAIKSANSSHLPIIAIDIPSGLNGDTGIVEGNAICAAETIFLGLPKSGFFLQDGWNYVGKLRHVDFGLPHNYIEESDASMVLLTKQDLKHSLPPILNSRHKYQAGYVVGLTGSPGMPGAGILACHAALRSGAGIVKMLHPAGMEKELAACPCEVIKTGYEIGNATPAIDLLNSATAGFIGPGIGKSLETRHLLKEIFPKLRKPCAIDADALTIIGEDGLHPPEGAILTPHAGEMIRLMAQSSPSPHSLEFLESCQKYCESHRVTLVLKGGPTFIFHPHEPIHVNVHGDPGMATAGSGDVLTGVIAALLAQGLSSFEAAKLGVFLHGTAGEYAADEKTSYSLIASDLISTLPEAFHYLMED
ncbi:NAD(P)H-hydrate dehydratase [Waddlia chondrophila]|uniref:Bifunctional NAD(P)H-hydrate repair enzyme n=1 Tax=Waddlia chondrophila (strain ATCC VR-1470 / WSU 86-1044) TaxID=716544 RepID=D6YSU1_WADCW|nr:NAD(P)H-hydrate dehydratase [Waddlia chondrophila]ADI39136.1 YjeF family protein [Waddlia chondrophila WSU 86-1044]